MGKTQRDGGNFFLEEDEGLAASFASPLVRLKLALFLGRPSTSTTKGKKDVGPGIPGQGLDGSGAVEGVRRKEPHQELPNSPLVLQVREGGQCRTRPP